MASERPKRLSTEELEQYDLLLEEQATPFEEQAIALHEANAARAREGIYDSGVQGSFGALAQLLPARFGKTEQSVQWTETMVLPIDASAPYREGEALRAAGKPEEAEAAFAKAVELAPMSAAALNELGLVQRQRGKFTAAAGTYGRALAIDPQFAPALRNLGVLRDLYLDDPAGAIAPFEQYQAVTGEDRPVTSWLADVKQRAGKRETATAPPAQVETQ
jgi:tetratricopeptide (TPR) repeat protein